MTAMDHGTAQVRPGLNLEALSPGDIVRHHPGRTITEFDDMLVALLTVNLAPLHIDAAYSAKTPQGRRIVNGLFIASIVVGLSNGDFRPDTSAPLTIDAIDHYAPTYFGNTIYVSTEIREVRRFDGGVEFAVRHRVDNEDGVQVMTMDRTLSCPLPGVRS